MADGVFLAALDSTCYPRGADTTSILLLMWSDALVALAEPRTRASWISSAEAKLSAVVGATGTK